MSRSLHWPRTTFAYAATLGCALLCVQPVRAQRAADLDARAAAEYNRGLDARDAGENRSACEHFRNAETLYHNSITALLEYPMYTEDQREEIKQLAAGQQSSLNGAKAKAAEVCGRPDSPVHTSSSSGSANSDSNLDAQLLELQRRESLAAQQYREADRLYQAGDKAKACTHARGMAAELDGIAKAMRANPALEKAFGNPAQIYENAEVAIELRDTVFCRKTG